MTSPASIDYHGIRFSPASVSILNGGREVVTIPLKTIRTLTLRRGLTAAHPVIQSLLGLGCCVLGLSALRAVALWFSEGGTLWDVQALLILVLPLGIALLWDALRPGFYLLLDTQTGSRKLPFEGGLDAAFQHFIAQAQAISRKAIDCGEVQAGGLTSA